ncbi:META domain-containing protein [Marinilabiliaceae bacterium JC017]|nr:META domain-containing protein [Marinilabiliaceae bacterium JC017]
MRQQFFFISFLLLTLAVACAPKQKLNEGTVSEAPVEEQVQGMQPEGPDAAFHLNKKEKGIDFFANGNEPNWGVELDFDKQFRFFTMDGDEITTPAVKGDKAQDTNVTRYRAVTEAGELIITLKQEKCVDDMSGYEYDYRVTVDVKKGREADYITYKGCGSFVQDPRLNGQWKVTNLEGQKLQADQFTKGLPQLKINLKEHRVGGHDGCNNIMGGLEVQGDRLVFSPMAGTLMACPHMETGNKILKYISGQTVTYSIEGGLLYVIAEGNKVLTLAKFD